MISSILELKVSVDVGDLYIKPIRTVAFIGRVTKHQKDSLRLTASNLLQGIHFKDL